MESFKCHHPSVFTPLFFLVSGGRRCLCVLEEGLNSVWASPPENSVRNLFKLYLFVFQTDFIKKNVLVYDGMDLHLFLRGLLNKAYNNALYVTLLQNKNDVYELEKYPIFKYAVTFSNS